MALLALLTGKGGLLMGGHSLVRRGAQLLRDNCVHSLL